MRKLYLLAPSIFNSFPVQLLLNNIRRNHILMLCWVILFAMITGNFGKYLGIPYLFLDPEYMNEVDFKSFFIMGIVTAGFITAFHITCYITDGHRFSFIGALSKPFTKFVINNSVIPLIYLATYVYQIIGFQVNNQYTTGSALRWNLFGLLCGFLFMTSIFIVYFWFTNKDIFKYVVCRIDEKIKEKVKVTRASVLKKLDIARKKQVYVDNYIDYDFKIKKIEDNNFYDKEMVLKVFDQNHLNLVIIELFIFAVVLVLGIFKDYPSFQLPAASSCIIFLTVFVMMSGAFTYWFGGWSATIALLLFMLINYWVGKDYFSKPYEAFGLDYLQPPADYSVKNFQVLNDTATIQYDKRATLVMLENWKKKFLTPPKRLATLFYYYIRGAKGLRSI